MKENNAIDMLTSEVRSWITSQAIGRTESVDAFLEVTLFPPPPPCSLLAVVMTYFKW